MTDHRRIQRTLFRMHADAGFAYAIRAGDRVAVDSTGLSERDVELLAAADPAGVAADPGGRRRTQVFGNAASEFTLTLAAAALRNDGPTLFDGFLSSDEFHAAIASEGRLPLAFADFAARRTAEFDAPEVAAILRLESAMTRLRRDALESPAAEVRTPSGSRDHADRAIRLSPFARTLELPVGTLDWAAELRAALDRGSDAQAPAGTLLSSTETVLLHAQRSDNAFRLPEITAELVRAPADEFLRRATAPVTRNQRAAFAERHDATADEFERYLDGLVDDGVLVRCD